MHQNKSCLAPGGQCDCIKTYNPQRVILTNAGETGTSIIGNGLGPNLTVKTLVEGTGMVLIDGPTGSVTIAQDPGYSNVTLTGTGTAATGTVSDLVVVGTGTNLKIKNLVAGSGVTFVDDPNGPLVINTTDALITLTGVGSGTTLVTDGGGPTLEIRNVIAGNGITVGTTGQSLQIVNSSPASAITLNGTGAGANLVVDGTPNDLSVRNIVGINGLTATITPGPPNDPFAAPSLAIGSKVIYHVHQTSFGVSPGTNLGPNQYFNFPNSNYDLIQDQGGSIDQKFWFALPTRARLVHIRISSPFGGDHPGGTIPEDASFFMLKLGFMQNAGLPVTPAPGVAQIYTPTPTIAPSNTWEVRVSDIPGQNPLGPVYDPDNALVSGDIIRRFIKFGIYNSSNANGINGTFTFTAVFAIDYDTDAFFY